MATIDPGVLESFAHRLAKDLVASWCREGCQSGMIQFRLPNGDRFKIDLDDQVKVTVEQELTEREVIAGNIFTAPSAPGGLPFVVADICISRAGKILLLIEMVCTHDLSPRKRGYLAVAPFSSVSIFAQRVLEQVERPEAVPAYELLGSASQIILNVYYPSVSDDVDIFLDRLMERQNLSRDSFHPFDGIDGLCAGRLVAHIGRPGSGITAMAMRIARNTANEVGSRSRVFWISYTAHRQDVLRSFLKDRVNGDPREWNDSQMEVMVQALTNARESRFLILDGKDRDPLSLLNGLRSSQRPGPQDLVIVDDLLTLMNRRAMSHGVDPTILCRRIATEIGCPTLLLGTIPAKDDGPGIFLSKKELIQLGFVFEIADRVSFQHARPHGLNQEFVTVETLRNRYGSRDFKAYFIHHMVSGILKETEFLDDDVDEIKQSRRDRRVKSYSDEEDVF